MSLGIFSAFTGRVLLCTLVYIFSVASVEASITAFQYVNVEGHASVLPRYSGDKQSNTTPFCIALRR
jgi:hypothetical protein